MLQDTNSRFFAIFYKGDNYCDFLDLFSNKREYFVTSCLFSLHTAKGSKFFPFRVGPVSEGRQNNFDRVASPESE